ncbi:MAG TPA: hypothetical protein VGI88_14720 [Verrucomicrobiae bacterium]
MQISRQLLLACAVAMCLTPALLRAYDNDAQIRARQALEEKMQQLDAQAPQTNSAPPPAAKKPAPAKKPKKAPAPPPAPATEKPAPPVVKSTPAAPAYENPPAKPAPEISQPATPMPAAPASSDQLHEALHEKMRETQEAPAAPVKPAPAAPVATKPAAPAAPVAKSPAPSEAAPAPMYSPAPVTPANSADSEKLREALDQKMKANEAAAAANPAPAPAMANTENPPGTHAAPKPTAKPTQKSPQPAMTLPQLSGPPSSLPAAKQQKLDELLQQYRADQLTPQQYHEQRAKILSEP